MTPKDHQSFLREAKTRCHRHGRKALSLLAATDSLIRIICSYSLDIGTVQVLLQVPGFKGPPSDESMDGLVLLTCSNQPTSGGNPSVSKPVMSNQKRRISGAPPLALGHAPATSHRSNDQLELNRTEISLWPAVISFPG